jgi:hypothetical protein
MLTEYPAVLEEKSTIAVESNPIPVIVMMSNGLGVDELNLVTSTARGALLAKPNTAFVPTPGTEPVTLKGPCVLFAVNAEAVATPLLLVAAVVVPVPFAKMPLAPFDGAVKVTVAFATRFPPASFTVACNNVVNVSEIGVD